MTQLTAKMDTSALSDVIPELVSFGRRTVKEQCVTSMGMILQDAQNWTPAVSIGQIDAELNEVDHVSGPRTKSGKAAGLGGLVWTKGMMIAVQRTNPNSPYSLMTGNRWPIANPGLKGIMRWRFFQQAAERMEKVRHSSTHFLQSGYIAARDLCVSSPFFKNRYRKTDGNKSANPMNTLDIKKLGTTEINDSGDNFEVISMNNVGEPEGRSNATLAAKHRLALIEHSSGPLQDAIDAEATKCIAELERRLNDTDGFPRFNKMLSGI